ncbi:MAG: hypothetical protein ACR2GY_10365 [Phycisphaerales bacterium]
MFEQLLSIARNTFFESIRQPIVLVLLVVATLLLLVASLTSTFTMDDDQKMFIDVGLATVLLFTTLLAAFISTSVITREIENRTVLTVVSKPVSRPVFVIGKYLGVAGANLLAGIYLCFVFVLIEHHGVLQTVRDPLHLPVIVFGFAALFIALGVSVWCNYFYEKVFASTMLCTITPLVALAYVLSLFFNARFEQVNVADAFNANIWKAVLALLFANLVLTAIAIAISARLNQMLTIATTMFVFVVGMLSDWLFAGQIMRKMEGVWLSRARAAGETKMVEVVTQYVRVKPVETIKTPKFVEQATDALSTFATASETVWWWVGKVGHSVVPNFQLYWLSDAVTQEHIIPSSYLVRVGLYAIAGVVAALAVAVILFQRREVG